MSPASFWATGATSAPLRALLRRLWADPAWAGVSFCLVGRGREALEALASEDAAGRCRAVVVDLGAADGPAALAAAVASGPPLRGLCLGAGDAEDAVLPKVADAAWDRVWRVQAGAAAATLAALARPGRLAPGARGLLVGSWAGAHGRAGQTAYAAAKGALEGLLQAAPPGLRLNLLVPPVMPTARVAALGAGGAALAAERVGPDPDPIETFAAAGQFLLSDAAGYLHGVAFPADGRVGA